MGQLRKRQRPIPRTNLGVVNRLRVLVRTRHKMFRQLLPHLRRRHPRRPAVKIVLLRRSHGQTTSQHTPQQSNPRHRNRKRNHLIPHKIRHSLNAAHSIPKNSFSRARRLKTAISLTENRKTENRSLNVFAPVFPIPHEAHHQTPISSPQLIPIDCWCPLVKL